MKDPVTFLGIDDNIHLIRATVKIIYWKSKEIRIRVRDVSTTITKDPSAEENQLPTFRQDSRDIFIDLKTRWRRVHVICATISGIYC